MEKPWEGKSAAEYAEFLNSKDPVGGFSWALDEDSDYWSERGINTGEDLEKSLRANYISDWYKEINGIRPRHFNFKEMSLDEMDQILETLRQDQEWHSAQEKENEELEHWTQEIEETEPLPEQEAEDPYEEYEYQMSPREKAMEGQIKGLPRVWKGKVKGKGPRPPADWKSSGVPSQYLRHMESGKMLSQLKKIADELDKKGFCKEADKIDVVIKKVAEMSTEDAWNYTDWPKRLKTLRLAELGLVQYANMAGAESEEEVPVYKSVLNCLDELRKAEEWYVNKLGGWDQTKDVGMSKEKEEELGGIGWEGMGEF